MMDDLGLKASISLEVDGNDLELPVIVRYRAPFEFWVATGTLPAWSTPRAKVAVTGIGNDRDTAVQDLRRTAENAIATYKRKKPRRPPARGRSKP